jgi:biotin operon repressor
MAKRVDCYICGKENLAHNEIGLNKKLIGRDVKKLHCLQCLADYLELSVDELEERVQEFKDAGCDLFE